MVIKLSFSAKVGRNGRHMAGERKYIALKTRPPFGSTLNFDPKGGHKGARKGKMVSPRDILAVMLEARENI